MTTETTTYEQLVLGGDFKSEKVLVFGADLDKGSVLASYGVATSDTKAKKSVTFTGATPVEGKKVAVTIGDKKFEYTIAESDTVSNIAAGLKALINNASTGSTLVEADNTSGKLELEAKSAGLDGNNIIVVAEPAEDSGVTAGDVSLDVVGLSVGDERFALVDSDSATSALQKPVAVLLEDAKAGEMKYAAFTGDFDATKLKFSDGDSLNNFKEELRKIGIFTKDVL